jgi:hypothetical protein
VSKAKPLPLLHDVDLLLQCAREPVGRTRLKRLGLDLDGAVAVERFRERLRGQIDQRWLAPYERALKRYGRGLVAVRDRVCLGCFITLPTSASPSTGDTVTVCESCGRLLYWP